MREARENFKGVYGCCRMIQKNILALKMSVTEGFGSKSLFRSFGYEKMKANEKMKRNYQIFEMSHILYK